MAEQIAVRTTVDLAKDPGGHPVLAYLASLRSPQSQGAMVAALERVLRVVGADTGVLDFPWQGTRAADLDALVNKLARRYAPGTVNLCLAAVKGVLRKCWELDLLGAKEWALVGQVRRDARSPKRGRALDQDGIDALMATCDPATPAGLRDGALLVLLLANLRRSEALALQSADVDLDTGQLDVRRGKGGKSRTAFVLNGGRDWLRSWATLRGPTPGPFITALSTNGKDLAIRSIEPHRVNGIVRAHATAAKLGPLTPHDLRRTYATILLQRAADPMVVASLMGHASLDTTRLYDLRGEDGKVAAAGLMHVPGPAERGGAK